MTARRVAHGRRDLIRSESYRAYPLGRAARLMIDVGRLRRGTPRVVELPDARIPLLPSSAVLAGAQLGQGDPRGAREIVPGRPSPRPNKPSPRHGRNRGKRRVRLKPNRPQGSAEVNDWLGKLACLQARLGDLPAAIKTLEGCPAGRERDQARIELARDRAEAGDVNTARSLIEDIQTPGLKREAWIAVACAIPHDDVRRKRE